LLFKLTSITELSQFSTQREFTYFNYFCPHINFIWYWKIFDTNYIHLLGNLLHSPYSHQITVTWHYWLTFQYKACFHFKCKANIIEVHHDIMNIKQGHDAKNTTFMRKLGYNETGEFWLALQLCHYESESPFWITAR
jgi:hypothetical protein